MSHENISHGRGGVANIGPDKTPQVHLNPAVFIGDLLLDCFSLHYPDETRYADAEIIREGPEGDQGDGAYSAGRGGRGNIGSPRVKPAHHGHDIDVVPETATRLAEQQSHHTGRGGEGNIHHSHEKEHPSNSEGLADKVKHKIMGDRKDN